MHLSNVQGLKFSADCISRVARRGKTVLDLYGRLPPISSPPSSKQQIETTSFGGDIPVDGSSDLSLQWNMVMQQHTRWLNATIRMKSNPFCQKSKKNDLAAIQLLDSVPLHLGLRDPMEV